MWFCLIEWQKLVLRGGRWVPDVWGALTFTPNIINPQSYGCYVFHSFALNPIVPPSVIDYRAILAPFEKALPMTLPYIQIQMERNRNIIVGESQFHFPDSSHPLSSGPSQNLLDKKVRGPSPLTFSSNEFWEGGEESGRKESRNLNWDSPREVLLTTSNTVHSGSIQTLSTYFTFCYVTALFWNWFNCYFPSSIYTQYTP
jgi:hypothetical protein